MTSKILTADLCARAIVAAAASYGDDPIQAVLAKTGRDRRSLSAAGLALAQVSGISQAMICSVLRLGAQTITVAKRQGGDPFLLAVTQALLATGGVGATLAPSEPDLTANPTIEGEFRVLEPALRIGETAVLEAVVVAAKPPKVRRPAPISAGPSNPLRSAALPPSKRDKVPEVFQRIWAEAAPPAPKSSTIRASDRALIDAAVAAGKVKVAPTAIAEGGGILGLAIADHPEPLTYDKVTRHYRRAT